MPIYYGKLEKFKIKRMIQDIIFNEKLLFTLYKLEILNSYSNFRQAASWIKYAFHLLYSWSIVNCSTYTKINSNWANIRKCFKACFILHRKWL